MYFFWRTTCPYKNTGQSEKVSFSLFYHWRYTWGERDDFQIFLFLWFFLYWLPKYAEFVFQWCSQSFRRLQSLQAVAYSRAPNPHPISKQHASAGNWTRVGQMVSDTVTSALNRPLFGCYCGTSEPSGTFRLFYYVNSVVRGEYSFGVVCHLPEGKCEPVFI